METTVEGRSKLKATDRDINLQMVESQRQLSNFQWMGKEYAAFTYSHRDKDMAAGLRACHSYPYDAEHSTPSR